MIIGSPLDRRLIGIAYLLNGGLLTRLIERDVDAKVEKKLGEIAEREAAAAAAKQAEMN